MKKGILLFVCLVMLLPILLHGEVKQVKVWGKIAGLAGREVVLLDSDYHTEIARVKGNGDRFEIGVKVEVGDARPYFIYVPALGDLGPSMVIPTIYFYIDTDNIQVEAKIAEGSLKKERIKGSPAMTEYEGLFAKNPCEKELDVAVNAYNKAFNEYNMVHQTEENLQVLKRAGDRLDSLYQVRAEAFLAMIPQNRSSKMLAVVVYENYREAPVEQLEQIVSQFDASIQDCYPLRMMTDRIARVKAAAVGSVAPEFELKDLNGNLVKLSSLRGKYVLIDFWASWCGPCRKEIPNVKNVYESFGDKGLVVIGVSVDNSEKAWRKAVDEEQVKYLQLHDAENAMGKLYNFNGIPFMTLISPEGVILERDLRGADVRKNVEKYLLGERYASIKKKLDEIDERYNKEADGYSDVEDILKKAEISEKLAKEYQKRTDFFLDGLKQLEGSQLGLELLDENLFRLEHEYDTFALALQALGNRLPESELRTKIQDKFEALKAEQLTGEAPDFELINTRGKKVRLSSFRGKEVLLDFWASWCAPCRSKNKELNKHYKELKKKGVEVISVSLDNDKKKWLEAVKQDKISWIQLADLNGFEKSEVKKAYKVKFVPTVYWIGTDGIIKAKNPKLEDLLR